jgi:hypothetical protein
LSKQSKRGRRDVRRPSALKSAPALRHDAWLHQPMETEEKARIYSEKNSNCCG